jgi:hypothetical protein
VRRVLLLAVVLASCGASEQQHVQQALRDYDRAWEREDYEDVCSRTTEAGRREWANLTRSPDCVSGIRALVRAGEEYEPPDSAGETIVLTLPAVELTTEHIRVEGDTATTYTRLGAAERLRKIDGRWLMDASLP